MDNPTNHPASQTPAPLKPEMITDDHDTHLDPVNLKTAAKRGILGRCPSCGRGKLFKSYLKQVDHCDSCHADFTTIRADDGPAWLTLFLAGHIIVPLSIYLLIEAKLSDGILFPSMFAAMVLLCLTLLPLTKGLFIALIWASRQKKH